MAEILIIDDDSIMSYTLARMVQQMGHTPKVAVTRQDGLKLALEQSFDVVLLDVRLPDGNGLEIIPRLKSQPSPPEIIIVTAYGDTMGAELSLKSGVWDYIEKPSRVDEMKLPLLRALEYRKQKLAAQTPFTVDRCGIVGSSTQMTCCVDLMAQASAGDANVLLSGETGTGKELFARAIHHNSRRGNEGFIVVDCAALPEHLVESILFGHVKGAFTGAEKASSGLIKQADGGTLFLDEVGELSLNLQKTFLRVLQEHRFRPVGDKAETSSDFRLIAATNRNLDQMTQKGLFRADLLHRLRTLSIELPPLRERKPDIKELVLHHVAQLCAKYNLESKGFAPEFLDTMANYPWPGNVRELVNALESAVSAASQEPILFPVHLPPAIRTHVAIASMKEATTPSVPITDKLPRLKNLIDETRKEYLRELFKQTDGNVVKACKIAGLSRASLYNYLKKYEID